MCPFRSAHVACRDNPDQSSLIADSKRDMQTPPIVGYTQSLKPRLELAATGIIKQQKRLIEKNLLGLKRMFLNSLRLCWTVSLLADAVVLLRALALMAEPEPTSDPLNALRPQQMTWNFPNQP